jgi:subtilisin family serine protease
MEEYVPGVLYCRVKTDAIRPHVGPEAMSFTSAEAAKLPENVAAPFEYLRKNYGLSSVTPLFAERKPGAKHRAPVGNRLALMASVVHPARERFSGYNALEIDPKVKADACIKKLESAAFVEFVERAPARYIMADEPDPSLNLQWGLRVIRYFQLKKPVDAGKVRVAVIDSGIDDGHPDFDAANISYDSMGFSKTDVIGHGTHVCGIIAAKANNGNGIAGIANCKLSVWRIFPDRPNSAGQWIADPNKFLQALGDVLDSGASVLNLSLGGPAKSQAEQDVISELTSNGILVVAAMGNHFKAGNPTCFPAAYKTTLAVGAVGVDLRRAGFSCTGSHIGMCAPGVGILSTLPTKTNEFRPASELGPMDGTSMATPHVAAAAALAVAHKDITGHEAGELLIKNARAIPEMKNKAFTKEHGHGLLDLEAALA